MAEIDLLASAAFGMEAIVVRELADLGYANATVDDGRIRFRGDLSAICRTNLWLRCAERVQIVVADFQARNFDDLFDQVKLLPWEEWLPVDARFPVISRCVRSEIRSVPNTQKMVKRAIVERLRKVYSRHWFSESGVEYPIEAAILGDRALITIDTSGDGLHKRGYRNLVGQAPLRETVAAALVKLSYWSRDRLLVDPFCGSGTIPIEAAMIGRNLAPGRNRSFQAENWEQIPRSTWTAARQEVKDCENRQSLSIPIIATDRDRSAIKMATQHARQAGVATDIHFDVKDFVAFPTNRDAGILICNPPYGERLGDENEVRQLYRDMGELLRPLDDWSLYVLTASHQFERDFGKPADRRRKLYNARIACTYYQYLGPKPAGLEHLEDLPPRAEAESLDVVPPISQRPDRPAPQERQRESQVKPDEQVSPDLSSARPQRPASENPWAKARLAQQQSQRHREQTDNRSREPEKDVHIPKQKPESPWTTTAAAAADSLPADSDVSETTAPETTAPETTVPEAATPAGSALELTAMSPALVPPVPPAPAESIPIEPAPVEPEPVKPAPVKPALEDVASAGQVAMESTGNAVPTSSPEPAKELRETAPSSSSPEPDHAAAPQKAHPWKKNPWNRG